MKYIIRRTLFAVITLPIVLGVYAVIYFGIGMLASTNTASVDAFTSNAWSVGIAWVLVVALAKQVMDWAKRVTA